MPRTPPGHRRPGNERVATLPSLRLDCCPPCSRSGQHLPGAEHIRIKKAGRMDKDGGVEEENIVDVLHVHITLIGGNTYLGVSRNYLYLPAPSLQSGQEQGVGTSRHLVVPPMPQGGVVHCGCRVDNRPTARKEGWLRAPVVGDDDREVCDVFHAPPGDEPATVERRRNFISYRKKY